VVPGDDGRSGQTAQSGLSPHGLLLRLLISQAWWATVRRRPLWSALRTRTKSGSAQQRTAANDAARPA